jgi:hypothetical protein
MQDKRGAYRILVGRPEGRDNLEELSVGWKIMLKWIFKPCDGEALPGLLWLRIGTGAGHL